jgi:hypothetical protein
MSKIDDTPVSQGYNGKGGLVAGWLALIWGVLGSILTVLTGGASSAVDVTFQDAATVAADGTVFTVGGNKTLTVEIYGTSTSRTIAFIGRGPSGVDRAIMGVRTSDFATGVSTTGSGEIWQLDITGLTSVFCDLQAVAGGSVSVKGRAVA